MKKGTTDYNNKVTSQESLNRFEVFRFIKSSDGTSKAFIFL